MGVNATSAALSTPIVLTVVKLIVIAVSQDFTFKMSVRLVRMDAKLAIKHPVFPVRINIIYLLDHMNAIYVCNISKIAYHADKIIVFYAIVGILKSQENANLVSIIKMAVYLVLIAIIAWNVNKDIIFHQAILVNPVL